MAHGKPGRPWKGDRKWLRAELPVELVAAVKALAERRNMSVTDLVGRMAERETGVPYDPTPKQQETLPLKSA